MHQSLTTDMTTACLPPSPPHPPRSATQSQFFAQCHKRRMVPDVEVVFLEFAIIDDDRQAVHLERLIRTLLQ